MQYKSINAVQIRVTLLDVEPEVWRRVIVPWKWNLAQVHLVIQAAFNWYSYHLHEFLIGSLRYGDADNDEGAFENSRRLFEEQDVRLLDFEQMPGAIFTYAYDLATIGDMRWSSSTITHLMRHPSLHPALAERAPGRRSTLAALAATTIS